MRTLRANGEEGVERRIMEKLQYRRRCEILIPASDE
jgi:hypothetical protein